MLKKTRFLMDMEYDGIDTLVEFGVGPDEGGWVLEFDHDRWEEMGHPRTITVTIEPGDKLNDG